MFRASGMSDHYLTKNNLVRNYHSVIINGSTNSTPHVLAKELKNVESVELSAAVIPLSHYRIDESNNKFPFSIVSDLGRSDAVVTLTTGEYANIIDMMIEINRHIREFMNSPETKFDLYDSVNAPVVDESFINVIVDSMSRKAIMMVSRNLNRVELPFDTTPNNCGDVLGFGQDRVVVDITTTRSDRIPAFYETSLRYIQDRLANNDYINNLLVSYYDSLLIFPLTFFSSDYFFVFGVNRINITRQIYVDISLDEIEYEDGTRRLGQVYVSEEDEVAYYKTDFTLKRRLKPQLMDISTLTINLSQVVSETVSRAYNLNGLFFSVTLEIVTLDNEYKSIIVV